MNIWQILFGKPKEHEVADDMVSQSVRTAVINNQKAASNLEAAIKELLDENARLRLRGPINAPHH